MNHPTDRPYSYVADLEGIIVTLTHRLDEARAALRALVDATSWENERCVIAQGPEVGSDGALDRAMALLVAWDQETETEVAE